MNAFLNSSFGIGALVAATIIVHSLITNYHERNSNKFYPPVILPAAEETEENWIEGLRARLRQEEGLKLTAYQDSQGVWTVGFGHTHRVREGLKIALEDAERYLEQDLERAVKDAKHFLADFADHPDSIKIALSDLAFVLGGHGLKTFTKLHAALTAKNYMQAAHEVLASEFHSQDSMRAESISKLINSTGG